MSEKQAMIKVLEEMPEDVTLQDITETLNFINELQHRINNFDKSKCLSSQQLKEAISLWQ